MNIERLKLLIILISILLLAWGVYLFATMGSFYNELYFSCPVGQGVCSEINQKIIQDRGNQANWSIGLGLILLIIFWLMGGIKNSRNK